jgi:benzoylformate decarboxylase
MYHEFADGDYLPAGAELWAVTSDPDEAARAPVGHILIGDPAEAVKRLADTIPAAGRPALTRQPLPEADTTGPAFTEEAIVDAVNAAKTDNTVFAHECTSTLVNVWDRLEITRPGSMYMSAGGGLGWGLPGAIGLQLADPSRRVVSLLGDGAVHYSVSGLWTAAQHNIPVVFVVARNSEYRALKEFSRFMHDPGAPGSARVTCIDPEGRNFIDDVKVRDLWNFRAGAPLSEGSISPSLMACSSRSSCTRCRSCSNAMPGRARRT